MNSMTSFRSCERTLGESRRPLTTTRMVGPPLPSHPAHHCFLPRIAMARAARRLARTSRATKTRSRKFLPHAPKAPSRLRRPRPPPSQARGCPTCVPRPKRQAGPWPSHPLFLPAEVVLSTLLRSRLELKLQRQQLAETRRRPTTWATPTRPANCTRVFRLATRSGAKPVTNSERGSFASQRATGNRCASGHPCRRSVSPEYVAVQPKQLPVLSVLSILVQLRR